MNRIVSAEVRQILSLINIEVASQDSWRILAFTELFHLDVVHVQVKEQNLKNKKAIPGIDESRDDFFCSVLTIIRQTMSCLLLARLFLDRLSRFVFGCSVCDNCVIDIGG